MSVAKVHTVNKSRKAQGRCGDCEKPIKAGDGYRWWTIGFRSRSKYKRCMACPVPPPSQRESSAAVAHILASQEMVYGALDACGSREDVVAALEDFASGISEAAETWGESADNIEQGFQHETTIPALPRGVGIRGVLRRRGGIRRVQPGRVRRDQRGNRRRIPRAHHPRSARRRRQRIHRIPVTLQ